MEIIELVIGFLVAAFMRLYLAIAVLIAGLASPESKDAPVPQAVVSPGSQFELRSCSSTSASANSSMARCRGSQATWRSWRMRARESVSVIRFVSASRSSGVSSRPLDRCRTSAFKI